MFFTTPYGHTSTFNHGSIFTNIILAFDLKTFFNTLHFRLILLQ
jgi:hypothetical protein